MINIQVRAVYNGYIPISDTCVCVCVCGGGGGGVN
jgi:hypothetical protein